MEELGVPKGEVEGGIFAGGIEEGDHGGTGKLGPEAGAVVDVGPNF